MQSTDKKAFCSTLRVELYREVSGQGHRGKNRLIYTLAALAAINHGMKN